MSASVVAASRFTTVTNPRAPARVGHLRLDGFAYELAVSGQHAFVASLWEGLQIVDVSNPAAPKRVAVFSTRTMAVDVAVAGSLAFVAADDGGLLIVDVSDSANPNRSAVMTHQVKPLGLPCLAAMCMWPTTRRDFRSSA